MTSQTTNKFAVEVRARAVRMVQEHGGEYPSRWAVVVSVAGKIGCSAHTLNEWLKKAEVHGGKRPGVTPDMAEKLKVLERENRELRQANEILRKSFSIFRPGGARPPVQAMIAFIDEHRNAYGVELMCRVLPIAPSSYHERVAQRRDPGRRSVRSQREEVLKPEVMRVFAENFGVYGVRKVWRQMQREGFDVARCTVQRRCGNSACKVSFAASQCAPRSEIRRRLARSITSTASSMPQRPAGSGSPILLSWRRGLGSPM
jgi:putative transposase